MKTPTMAQIVRRVVNLPSFQEAWNLTGEAGIGSVAATNKIHRLITASDWHLKALNDISHKILKDAAVWADKDLTEENLRDFHLQITQQLTTIAAIYTIVGIMVGTVSAGMNVQSQESHSQTGESNDADHVPTTG